MEKTDWCDSVILNVSSEKNKNIKKNVKWVIYWSRDPHDFWANTHRMTKKSHKNTGFVLGIHSHWRHPLFSILIGQYSTYGSILEIFLAGKRAKLILVLVDI